MPSIFLEKTQNVEFWRILDEALLFGASPQEINAVLDVFTGFIAFAASFGLLEVRLDFSEATFIPGTANAGRFIPNQVETNATARLKHFAGQTFVFTVGSVVDFKEFQLPLTIEPAVSLFGRELFN
jgi:hypothetical protein